MNKIILGITIGIIATIGTSVFAFGIETKIYTDNGIRFLRGSFESGNWIDIESFEDTNTGIICYVSKYSGHGVGISCVKK